MKVIKPIYLDTDMGVGLFILIAESGIDIELLKQLSEEFKHKNGTRLVGTKDYTWLELVFKESYLNTIEG